MLSRLTRLLLASRKLGSPEYVDKGGQGFWLGWDHRDNGVADWHYITDARRNNSAAIVRLRWNEQDSQLVLADITIAPQYRRRGLGSFLINKAKQFAVELGKTEIVGHISRLDIEGHPDNDYKPQPHLPEFYRRHGFKVALANTPSSSWGTIRWERRNLLAGTIDA